MNKDYFLSLENKKNYESSGYIVSEVSNSQTTSSFVFKDLENTKILIRTSKLNNYSYGDKIKIKGKLDVPESFKNDNGIVFNYQKFLQKDFIYYTSFYPEIDFLESASLKDFKFYIFYFKKKLVERTRLIFQKETSSLILGVLLGLEDSFDENLKENFRRTGLIHILVLSGFNLTIIAYFIFKLLSFVSRKYRFIISLLLIWIFVIMVGAGATVVRAGIMITVFIFGKLFYRNSSSLNALILAASLMLYLNPIILLYDPSFQLSFIATFGLLSFYKYIEIFFKFLTNKFGIKEIIVANISVQITIIPLLIYLMGEFSIISLIPNIIVLPLVPILMLFSFVSIIISFLNFNLAFVLILITEFFSVLILSTVNYFGTLSFAVLKTGQIDVRFLLLILFTETVFIGLLNLREKIILKQKYNYLQS